MPRPSIAALPWAVVDVETTGLYAATGDRVCEVAVGRVEDGASIDIFSSLVDPGRPIDPAATEVNGLRDADVSGAPRFEDLVSHLDSRFDGAVVIAHNAPFDIGFLAAEYAIARHPTPAVPVLDTLAIARKNFAFPSNRLGELARRLGVCVGERHRAAGDVLTTFRVFERLVDLLSARGCPTTLDGLTAAQGGVVPFRLPRPHPLPEPLDRALVAHHPVTICYTDGGGRTSERIVHPLWVNHRYLIAYCESRKSQRTFRIDRIVDAWES